MDTTEKRLRELQGRAEEPGDGARGREHHRPSQAGAEGVVRAPEGVVGGAQGEGG